MYSRSSSLVLQADLQCVHEGASIIPDAQAALTLSPGTISVLLSARSLLRPNLLLTFGRHLLLLLWLARVVFHLHDHRHPWDGECGSYQHDHRFPAWCNRWCGAWYDCDRRVDSARSGQCMVLSGSECGSASLRTQAHLCPRYGNTTMTPDTL